MISPMMAHLWPYYKTFRRLCLKRYVEARGERFVSIQDLKQRAKLSSSCIDLLHESGALKGMSDTNQVDFFSLL